VGSTPTSGTTQSEHESARIGPAAVEPLRVLVATLVRLTAQAIERHINRRRKARQTLLCVADLSGNTLWHGLPRIRTR
jgi:hypothetical protein